MKDLIDLRYADNVVLVYDHKDTDKDELDSYKQLVTQFTGLDPLTVDVAEKELVENKTVSKQFGILIIDDITDITNRALAKLLGTIKPGEKNINLVVVNDPKCFYKIYKDTYGCKPKIKVLQKNEFGTWLAEHFKVEDINIAIVTDNIDAFYSLIKWSFGDLGNQDVDPEEDIEEFTDKSEKDDIKGHRHNIPLCHPFIPKLIQAWIYCVWYKKPIKHHKPHKPPIKDNEDETFTDDSMDTTSSSYIRDSISIKINGGLYLTFWLIVPQADVDLALLCRLMDYVYMDLASTYPLNAMYTKEFDTVEWKKVIPFLFSTRHSERLYGREDQSIGEWSNIGRNIATFMRYTVDSWTETRIIDKNQTVTRYIEVQDEAFINSYIRHGCIMPHKINFHTAGIIWMDRIVKPEDILHVELDDPFPQLPQDSTSE